MSANGGNDATLLDALMPAYDVVERHRTAVRADPAAVFAALRSADLASGAVTRTLLAMRAVPAAIGAIVRSPRAARAELAARRAARGGGFRLGDFERAGFRVVAERPPEEIVLGLLGRFWTPRGGLVADVSAAHFAAGPPAGLALAAWNFRVVPRNDGTSELHTETRARCAPDVHARFRTYWLFIRPGSGLIRRAMLRSIRREAERGGATQTPAQRPH